MKRGNATITYPIDLTTICANMTEATAGHTVYMRGGTYDGDFICTLVGTAEAPIVIRPYQNEHVVIDGGITFTVRVHNAQDYFVDYADLTVSGTGTVTVDMRAASHSVAARVDSETVVATSFPKFGAFVLEKI